MKGKRIAAEMRPEDGACTFHVSASLPEGWRQVFDLAVERAGVTRSVFLRRAVARAMYETHERSLDEVQQILAAAPAVGGGPLEARFLREGLDKMAPADDTCGVLPGPSGP